MSSLLLSVSSHSLFLWGLALIVYLGFILFSKDLNTYVSYVIHKFLIWRYPIQAIADAQPMPTCPYRWPNGQGDLGKFIEGQRNREVWREQHGPIYRIWSGMCPEVVIKDPADIRIIFKDSDKHTKAVNNNAGWLMGELLGKCLGLISGADYQTVRIATCQPFTQNSAVTYLERITSITTRNITMLSIKGKLQHGYINPVTCLARIPFEIMTDILYGGPLPSDLKAELDSLVALREQLWSRMIQGGLTRFSLNQYLPTKTRRNLRDFKRRWAALNDRAYAIACMTQTQSAIVSLYGKVMNGNVEKDQVLQTIDEMLFANLDVTIGGLSWSLLFLAAHKDIQVKLWQEIKEAKVGPGVATRGWDDYIQSSSTLLAASILEAARLKPLAAFSVPQSAPTHRTVKGFHIPRGTNIIVDVHALNIENPFWGPDGDTYRPERFLKDCKLSDLRYNFWRFGFGPRQCLGKFIVDLIIRVVVATLVSEYNLGFTDITHWDKHPSTWILHPDTEIRCDKIIAKG